MKNKKIKIKKQRKSPNLREPAEGLHGGAGGEEVRSTESTEKATSTEKVSDGTKITRFAAAIMHVLVNRILQKGFPSAEPVSGQIFIVL
jgi:hypothetical protein